ncbi:MAG: flagellar hook protein FlgE [Desulfobulbaceae bacterium]|jgi:flagellar hook protein FlgE|nr:flagellar hook protein FlgE [Desulfobulbaceae bacterium]
MGIASALYSGVSGLNTNSQAMSVIGNNLANTNTIGFKGARTVFSDLLSSSISGSGGRSQVGRGVNMSIVDNIYSQGTFETTESGLDIAIEGQGFFLLKQPGNDTAYYSRAGAFRFDDQGYLVNPEGMRVQGQAYDDTGVLTPGDPRDIRVSNAGLIKGRATTAITLNTNLDSAEEIITLPFDITDPNTFNYSSSTQTFDSLGNPHLLTTYFRKTGANEWEWHWSAELPNGTVQQGAGGNNLYFTPEGLLTDTAGGTAPAVNAITGAVPAIDWQNGTTPTAVSLTFDTTQFNSESMVISQDQDGYAAGELTGIAIDGGGAVIASYSNGEQRKVSHMVLARFTNPNGLEASGSNTYIATTESGPARTGLPGAELGKIFTNSLEMSNVDMGSEFVRMITVQRGFQANSKIITTVDELLGELINLKR